MKQIPLRIGLIGAGANTRARHIPGLQAIPGVELAGVVNRSPASSQAVADAFGIPKIYRHWQEAIADPDTDAIVIGTWPNLHACASIAALEAGKHVLTEARMACNAAEAHAMLAAAQRRPDLIAQVVPAPFSLGIDATLQRLLAEGYLGDLLYIEHTAAAPALADPDAPWHWRRDRDRSGLNVAMLGIVYEMILRWVGAAVRVTALSRTFFRQARDEAGALHAVDVPDHVDVLADLACGAQLHIQQSVATAWKAGDGTWLYGTEGVLRFHGEQLTGARRGADRLEPIAIPDHERGGWRVEEEFIGAIRGTETVRLTPFIEGVKYMEFVEAVARSAAQGRHIALPLVLNG